MPARRIEADFTSPSWLGDTLDIALAVARVGRTSLELDVAFTCAGAPRWTAHMVLVMIDMADGKATPWPDDLRAKLEGSAG